MLQTRCLLLVVLLSRQLSSLRSVSRQTWGRLLILGVLLYAVTQGASFVALAYLPAVTVTLLWSFSNVTVALMGIVWLAERPTRFQWLGVGLATLGAVIYFYPVAFPTSQLFGVFVAACGVLANAGASILGRDVNRTGHIPPLVVTIVSIQYHQRHYAHLDTGARRRVSAGTGHCKRSLWVGCGRRRNADRATALSEDLDSVPGTAACSMIRQQQPNTSE
jgi:uncharacterized membrane protein